MQPVANGADRRRCERVSRKEEAMHGVVGSLEEGVRLTGAMELARQQLSFRRRTQRGHPMP